VGKTTLIKSLVKHYTRHNLASVKGPITVVSGKQRRLQLVECGPELSNMVRARGGGGSAPAAPRVTPRRRTPQIDAAKFADLVLLLVDGNFGFEMETFEFLNILQARPGAARGRPVCLC
jgi:ribosome biogenesis protein BMS1